MSSCCPDVSKSIDNVTKNGFTYFLLCDTVQKWKSADLQALHHQEEPLLPKTESIHHLMDYVDVLATYKTANKWLI